MNTRRVVTLTWGSLAIAACALAIEVKKIFMDEWSGTPDPARIELIRQALVSSVPGLLSSLEQLNHRNSSSKAI